jgi:heme exporter protein B
LAGNVWWLIHKDLVSEWRARRAWPAMLVLGAVVAVLVSLQLEWLPHEKPRVAGGLLWLAIFFAGMIAVDRSFAAEREEGCWEGLTMYPLSPTAIYLAKLFVNMISLAAVQVVLIPLFGALCDVPLLASPAALLLVAALGNIGIASVGTLLSAVAARVARENLLVILVLPLVIPVLVAAAEASRLLTERDFGGSWWQWIQLLAAFGVIYVTAGIVLFEFVMEE